MNNHGIIIIAKTSALLGVKMLMVITAAVTLGFLVLCCGCSGEGGAFPATTATAQGIDSLGFTVGKTQGAVGSFITVPVVLDSSGSTRAVTCTLSYDPTILAPGDASTNVSIQDNTAYVGSGIASRRKWLGNGSVALFFAYNGSNSSPTVAEIPFKIIAPGTSNLNLINATAYDASMTPRVQKARGVNGRISGR